jgi:hypothetical protein
MKVTTKTIKGWANNSYLFFSENTTNDLFKKNLSSYVKENLQGYKELKPHETLRDKNATHKVIIKGWYWRGSWNDPKRQTVTVYFK